MRKICESKELERSAKRMEGARGDIGKMKTGEQRKAQAGEHNRGENDKQRKENVIRGGQHKTKVFGTTEQRGRCSVLQSRGEGVRYYRKIRGIF
jgi:hypothetical protein